MNDTTAGSGSAADDAADDDVVIPPGIDITIPSIARAYDYALGGKNYFEVDRKIVDTLKETFPGVLAIAKINRTFLQRGVAYLTGEAGIRQFIDVGSGLPSAGNVHEVAHKIDPTARVVYVDHDPIVLAHGRALLADNASTTVIQADAADPQSILDDPVTREFIDFDKPFAVLLSGIIHHLSDEQDPVRVAQTFTAAMPSGSYLLSSNFLDDDDPEAKQLEAKILGAFRTGRFRTWEEQRAYFDGLEMVEPGLVYANDWHPDVNTEKSSSWHTFYCGGIGKKP